MNKHDEWQNAHMDRMTVKFSKIHKLPERIAEQAERQGISKAEYITKALIIQLEKDENR